MTWAIKDWDDRWENAASRKLVQPTYIPLYIEQGSENFRTLMETWDGAAAFGHFIALVELAATMPRRGVFCRSGKPLNVEQCAARIGVPTKMLAKSWKTLADIGWLVRVEVSAGDPPPIRQSSASHPPPARHLSASDPPVIRQQGPPPARHSSANKTSQQEAGEAGEAQQEKQEKSGDAKLTLTDAMRVPWPIGFDSVLPRWGDWLRARYGDGTKRVFTRVGLEIQIGKLVQLGPKGANDAIEHSLAQGWKGIFPAKEAANGRSGHRERRRAAEYDEGLTLPVHRVSLDAGEGGIAETPM